MLGYQQPTVISTVHEVAVRAALAVWALGICGVGIKLPAVTSKLLLGQPSHASRVLNWQQLTAACGSSSLCQPLFYFAMAAAGVIMGAASPRL